MNSHAQGAYGLRTQPHRGSQNEMAAVGFQ